MVTIKLLAKFCLAVSLLISTSFVYAWHNDFSIVNNGDEPLTFSISTKQGGAHPDSNCANGRAIPAQRSCHIELTDSYKFPKGTGHEGSITLRKKSGENCNIHYEYILNDLSYSKKRSVKLKISSCSANFKNKEITFVNDQIKTMSRPMLYLLDLPLVTNDIQKSTESYSDADCADPTTGEEKSDNCVIVTPSFRTQNGTPINEALAIQNNIDRYESLNHAQWIGTHNSAIGPAYTTDGELGNVSFSDPDNFLSLSKQLTQGVSQIELDILWHNNAVRLCHDHLNIPSPLDKVFSNVLCEGNAPMSRAVNELGDWVKIHPNQLVIVLLDINQDLGAHVQDINTDLASIGDKIFSPQDAAVLFKRISGGQTLPPNTLPTAYLSKNDILKTGKQVIFVADTDQTDLSPVNYLFLHMYNNKSSLLYQHGVDNFNAPQTLCSGANKYKTLQRMFDEDSGHFNIWRTNGDRTLINYLSSANGSTSGYNDYVSLATIKALRKCPFNVMSLNMFGFTCNKSNINECKYHSAENDGRPLDPRLPIFLWSWDRDFPLQATNVVNAQAYIVPNVDKTSIHFQNDDVLAGSANQILCHIKDMTQTQRGSDEWYIAPLLRGKPPALSCGEKGEFASPVTSYQMDDVWLQLQSNSKGLDGPILINYHYSDENKWQANGGQPLQTTLLAHK